MNYFSAIFIFSDNTKARYVKLHSLWDERDQNYNAVDKSTYKANIWNFFEVSFIANGKTNSWSYDSRGNRISESVSFGDNPGSINYYDYYSNSDLISKAGNWYFNYDKNGNLIAKGSSAILYPFDTFTSWDFAQNDGELWVYEYDLQNRMINAFYSGKGKANLKHRASYSYDYRGLLVQKNYNDYDLSNYIQLDNPSSSKEITEYYEYSPDDKLIYNEKIEDSCVHITDFIWTDTTLWSQLSNNNVFYHHSDHLGTSELISDSLGNVVWHADYDAFGNLLNVSGYQSFAPFFTGKFFDKTTGLYYFNARWYDSALGRFTTQDPARDGVNWWAYCGGNPLKFVDPDGREIINAYKTLMTTSDETLGKSSELISKVGCVLTAYTRIASAIIGDEISLNTANQIAKDKKLFTDGNLLTPENGAELINSILKEMEYQILQ
jgi:RHS repeat-associated protein